MEVFDHEHRRPPSRQLAHQRGGDLVGPRGAQVVLQVREEIRALEEPTLLAAWARGFGARGGGRHGARISRSRAGAAQATGTAASRSPREVQAAVARSSGSATSAEPAAMRTVSPRAAPTTLAS